jgi:hypothetical protein
MTSPSEHKAEQKVNAALNASVEQLGQQTQSEIGAARKAALNVLRQPAKPSISEQIGQWISQPFSKVAFPVAAVVLIGVSLNYNATPTLPPLPLAMVGQAVPTEDLSLLENLEFVTWLAENEQQAQI